MNKRLQVFVSSTFTDLIEERQSAVSAILKSGHIPAGMELFKAGDKSQLDIIKRWIDESDVYMLILGGRYGSIEPESALSYTELEYNYALAIGKPLFACVINKTALEGKVKSKGTSILEMENPQLLSQFREKVLSNMSAFFDDCKDIRLCVLESLPEISATRDLSGWVSGKEIPDTKGLVDEITKLNKENAELKKENSILNKKIETFKAKDITDDFKDLSKICAAIEITVPAAFLEIDTDHNTNLLDLFYASKESFIKGITNRLNQHESTYFLYNNICPKLQIHGLMQNEKVSGAQYRRFAITKKGEEYLAYIERAHILSKKK
ncbi:MAG: DUF4062 domain-containing protein [Moraxellaceae bacterium]